MNKASKSLIVLFLAFLLGSCFNVFLVQAQGNGTNLKIIKKCDIRYPGENCVAEMTLANNTGKTLEGEAFLHIDYQGPCSSGQLMDFDGEGITAQFYIGNWLNFSGWENGTSKASGFAIAKNETQTKLKIETVPNLCPGEYSFILEIKGTAESGEEYTTPPVVSGGGGGYYTPPVPTTGNGEVTATPGQGGITTLTILNQGQIKLIVPAGAVPENTTFTIKAMNADSINQPDPGSGLFLIDGLVYEIKAQMNGESVTDFNKFLTLIFTYNEEQTEGMDESSFKIHWWNGTEWVGIENSEVNTGDNTVTCSINHFTVFALLGSRTGFSEEEIKKEEPAEEEGIIETIRNIPERIAEEIERIVEGTASPAPIEETEEPEVLTEEVAPSKQTEIPQGALASLLAAIGMVSGKIGESAFLTIVVILGLLVLVLISVRELFLFLKKRKK